MVSMFFVNITTFYIVMIFSVVLNGYTFRGTVVDTTPPSKLLFRRLETVSPSHSQTEASLYESLLQKVKERKHAHENRKEPRDTRAKSKAQEKQKQDQLLAAARIQHEAVAKRARFEQVWKSRRDGAKASAEGVDPDPMRGLFQLYDVVRVDEESAETLEKREKARRYVFHKLPVPPIE